MDGKLEPAHSHMLTVRSLGIDTYNENIIFMRADCHVCKSEGFRALTRIVVSHEDRSIVATLDVVHSDLIKEGEAGLSLVALERLGISDGDPVILSHLQPLGSLSDVRSKMYRNRLDESAFKRIISDVTRGLYSNIELAAFISACSGDNLDTDEIISLTKAMIGIGQRIRWNKEIIADKHCVGGLPGNRTTPIVVAIAAAAGLVIPKTSSRGITSPSGTADTMETMTPVNLSIDDIMHVVEKEGACLVWGGRANLSPADDILIGIERALDIDSAGQMIASVLSKKAVAGSTHVIIEIPYGETAKVRTMKEALKLQYYFKAVANAIGLTLEVLITDGSQPVGRGIGPALEAMDVLAVLRNESNAPLDLKERAITLAAALLELVNHSERKKGREAARSILESGAAWEKFHRICIAQGGFTEPKPGKHKLEITSEKSGIVKAIDNRKLARIAKLAGAPLILTAGLHFDAPIGKRIEKGQTLFTIYSEAEGELRYSYDYLKAGNHIITIE
ncbi:MAG: thymidine phosphorylase family protein [Bacteroidota bacterium]|nr:thymidine phosphorylase family protein [Bacteroidota bacterium]MDP4237071.1 thymidine phosphorylase family protein [Bacteroidota bacterium]